MIYLKYMVLICLVLGQTVVAFGADRQIKGEEAAQLLERIKVNQAGIKTITGSFKEERTISTMPMPLVFTGKVYARPPGFLFLSYEEPVRHIMKVADDTVLFYVEDAPTADIVNMKAVGEGAPPNLFGWDPTDFKGEILETENGFTLYNPEIKAGDREIRITLDKTSLMVQALIMQEPGGDITKITMADLVVNGAIPAWVLEYTLPAGVVLNVMGQ